VNSPTEAQHPPAKPGPLDGPAIRRGRQRRPLGRPPWKLESSAHYPEVFRARLP
jgi:hypothetical protein